jgi:amino acid permease
MRAHSATATPLLTRFAATALMVGAGVGAGIMALPALAERVGLLPASAVLAIAWLASLWVHLMLAEVALRTGEPLQVLELMGRYVLRRGWLTWSVFGLLAVAFFANLGAYLAGAGVIVSELTGASPRWAQVVVYLLAAGVVLFGLRGVGTAERFGALALLLLVALIAGASLPLMLAPQGGVASGWRDYLALYAMAMYAYWTFYSVPQVIAGRAGDARGAIQAITWGLALNGLLTVVVMGVALALPGPVTPLAITGIAAAIAPWVGTAGSLLVLVALLTSYWSVSLALADIIRERSGLGHALAWVAATLPPMVVITWGGVGFVDSLRLAAGATGLVLALVTLPMVVAARREGTVRNPGWSLGAWGSPAVLWLALVLLLAMAVGSVLPLT